MVSCWGQGGIWAGRPDGNRPAGLQEHGAGDRAWGSLFSQLRQRFLVPVPWVWAPGGQRKLLLCQTQMSVSEFFLFFQAADMNDLQLWLGLGDSELCLCADLSEPFWVPSVKTCLDLAKVRSLQCCRGGEGKRSRDGRGSGARGYPHPVCRNGGPVLLAPLAGGPWRPLHLSRRHLLALSIHVDHRQAQQWPCPLQWRTGTGLGPTRLPTPRDQHASPGWKRQEAEAEAPPQEIKPRKLERESLAFTQRGVCVQSIDFSSNSCVATGNSPKDPSQIQFAYHQHVRQLSQNHAIRSMSRA